MFDHLDIVVDVGGIYDPARNRYDHHQSTFEESWNSSPDDITKLSSAGLIWRHFGKEIVANAILDNWGVTLPQAKLEKVHSRIYKKLILEVDAQDNGVSEAESMKYYIKTGLGARIARTNPEWNAPKTKTQHGQFKKAMKIAEEEFFWALRGIVLIHMPAYNVVREAFDAREAFHPCGEIMFMDRWAPWKDYVFEIEKELEMVGKLKFMLSQDQRGLWKIQTMSKTPGSFDIRVPLCESWRGLRNTDLNEVTGLPDTEFVHRAGFIGGAWSKESAINMALKSIEEDKKKQ